MSELAGKKTRGSIRSLFVPCRSWDLRLAPPPISYHITISLLVDLSLSCSLLQRCSWIGNPFFSSLTLTHIGTERHLNKFIKFICRSAGDKLVGWMCVVSRSVWSAWEKKGQRNRKRVATRKSAAVATAAAKTINQHVACNVIYSNLYSVGKEEEIDWLSLFFYSFFEEALVQSHLAIYACHHKAIQTIMSVATLLRRLS